MSVHKSAQSPPDSSTLPSDTLDEIFYKYLPTYAIDEKYLNELKQAIQNLLAEAYQRGLARADSSKPEEAKSE